MFWPWFWFFVFLACYLWAGFCAIANERDELSGIWCNHGRLAGSLAAFLVWVAWPLKPLEVMLNDDG